MATPWLHLVGIHPAGLPALTAAARQALDSASIVFGSPRHLALAQVGDRGRVWPVPFDVAPVLAHRGQATVAVLASGDPFYHGAGASLARHLVRGEWRNHPQPSSFALMAGELGWPQEGTHRLGLHARPFELLTPLLAEGERFLCLLRDAAAAPALADWLTQRGWGDSPMSVFSQLGGPTQAVADGLARELAHALAPDRTPMPAPLAAAFEARGGAGLSRTPGRPTAAFAHDGQITKSPVRAITLAALAPRAGECLWDLGAGSGSVAIEWGLAGGGPAVCVEQHPSRAAHIADNARRYGVALQVHQGLALDLLPTLAPAPQAVFVGGGFDAALFDALRQRLTTPWRLVVNAVALDTQALLMQLHRVHGGQLLQLQWSEAAPLGRLQAWQPARAGLQWSWACTG